VYKNWIKSDLENQLNKDGWKLHCNESLEYSTLGSDFELHLGGRVVDFSEYKSITKKDVVDYYSKLKKDYLIVDVAFDRMGSKLENTVAVYVRMS
tara:strand:+ start:9028 stop:9312 length:285 start_codon:yes stop_codon:yes gene_type:complete